MVRFGMKGATVFSRHISTLPSNIIESSAMDQEFQALLKNDTWRLVTPKSDVNVIYYKWVLQVKKHVDGSIERYKALLVANGFKQRYGLEIGRAHV